VTDLSSMRASEIFDYDLARILLTGPDWLSSEDAEQLLNCWSQLSMSTRRSLIAQVRAKQNLPDQGIAPQASCGKAEREGR
jgi:hypothetical protein